MGNKRSEPIYSSDGGMWLYDKEKDKWIGVYTRTVPPSEVKIKAQEKIDNADILRKGLT
jgi:hypothetical protein